MAQPTKETVVLRGGFVAQLAMLKQLWALEDRGCRFSLQDDGSLHIATSGTGTEAELTRRRAHRTLARALVAYRPPDDGMAYSGATEQGGACGD